MTTIYGFSENSFERLSVTWTAQREVTLGTLWLQGNGDVLEFLIEDCGPIQKGPVACRWYDVEGPSMRGVRIRDREGRNVVIRSGRRVRLVLGAHGIDGPSLWVQGVLTASSSDLVMECERELRR